MTEKKERSPEEYERLKMVEENLHQEILQLLKILAKGKPAK